MEVGQTEQFCRMPKLSEIKMQPGDSYAVPPDIMKHLYQQICLQTSLSALFFYNTTSKNKVSN